MGGICLTPRLCYDFISDSRKVDLVMQSRASLLCFIFLLLFHWRCRSFQICRMMSRTHLDHVCLLTISDFYDCWVLIRLTGRIPSRIDGYTTCQMSLWRDWSSHVVIMLPFPDKQKSAISNKYVDSIQDSLWNKSSI